jgi:hypothetical protein
MMLGPIWGVRSLKTAISGKSAMQDQRRLCGGLFVDRAAALRFALFENGHRPQAVVMVPGVFELDLSGAASDVHQSPRPADALRVRLVA